SRSRPRGRARSAARGRGPPRKHPWRRSPAPAARSRERWRSHRCPYRAPARARAHPGKDARARARPRARFPGGGSGPPESLAAPASALFVERGELLGLVLCEQRLRQLRKIAVHDVVDLVEGETDAVIGDPSLRKIVSADAPGTVARADQGFARRGFLRLLL